MIKKHIQKKVIKTVSLLMITTLIGAFIGPSVTFAAATWSEQDKITQGDPGINDHFGNAAAISGEYAVIGVSDDDIGANSNQGSAYVFQKSGTNWVQRAKLTASDGAASDQFGYSVGISGNVIVVGAGRKDTNTGAAYIFEGSGSSWSQTAKLTDSDLETVDHFGDAVAISGDYVIVGAWGDSDVASAAGAAYIYEKPGGGWANMTEATQKITAGDGAASDFFGSAVSIDGDYAVIGAYGVGTGVEDGSAYIFKRGAPTWAEEDELTPTGVVGDDEFGKSVSISGSYAIVGAHNYSSAKGRAYLFERSGVTWSQVSQLYLFGGGTAGDEFAWSVAISGNTVLIGATGVDATKGAIYFFEKPGTGWPTYLFTSQKVVGSDTYGGDQFGQAVAIDGYYSVGTAEYEDDVELNSGAGYIFVSSVELVPEFNDYIYILTILIAVGLMSKVIPKFSTIKN